MIIYDEIRFKCSHVDIHEIVRLHDQLWIWITNEF
jgi:hypothetical protein